MTLDELNRRFGLAGVLEITRGEGGLACVAIRSTGCEAKVFLQGGHVATWQPRVEGGKPVLFMSQKCVYAPGKPLRGGVPVCFPWFGPATATAVEILERDKHGAHGFARLLPWEIEATRLGDGGKVALVLVLRSNDVTRAIWPHEFELRQRITAGPDSLIIKLEVTNTGNQPLRFEEALHTYLAVADVERISVEGFESTEYLDKPTGMARKVQDAAPAIVRGEVNRVYLNIRRANVVHDPVWGRRITVSKSDSENTVFWNPGAATIRNFADLGEHEWRDFVCIETANIGVAMVTVRPGEVHQMRAVIGAAR